MNSSRGFFWILSRVTLVTYVQAWKAEYDARHKRIQGATIMVLIRDGSRSTDVGLVCVTVCEVEKISSYMRYVQTLCRIITAASLCVYWSLFRTPPFRRDFTRCYTKRVRSSTPISFSHTVNFLLWSSWKQKKTCRRVVRTSVWLISYSGELCNKNYIIKTTETLIIWSSSCYTDGSE